jgi:hypothetical protein
VKYLLNLRFERINEETATEKAIIYMIMIWYLTAISGEVPESI